MAKLFINGQEASVDLEHYTVFHGNSIFTTMRSKAGELCYWPEHYARLKAHAEHFVFAMPQEQKLKEEINQYLRTSPRDQKIRIILNDIGYAITLEDYSPPQSAIYEGVEVIISKHKPHPQLQRFKTGNSLPYTLALREAREAKVFEALLVDQAGFLVDGSRTSLLHWDGKQLFGIDGGLDGIMSKMLRSYAEALGLKVGMKFMTEQEFKKCLANKDGQFLLANSLIGVVPVGAVSFDVIEAIIKNFRD